MTLSPAVPKVHKWSRNPTLEITGDIIKMLTLAEQGDVHPQGTTSRPCNLELPSFRLNNYEDELEEEAGSSFNLPGESR